MKIIKEDSFFKRIEHYNNNNKCHRIGQPAIQWMTRDYSWLFNGMLHKINGSVFDKTDLMGFDNKYYLFRSELKINIGMIIL